MYITLFLVLSNFGYILKAEPANVSLELLQVFFRHGARYLDQTEVSIAGGDEYLAMFNNTDNFGELLTIGKKQEYEFGQMMRARYDQFLGEYKTSEVYARSTDYARTKMSLQLALAGLYPPSKSTSWSDTLPWIPIPTIYEKEKQIDFLDVTADAVCMKNGELVGEVIKSPEIINKMGKYNKLAQKLKSKIGLNEWIPYNGYNLYAYVNWFSIMGLALPSWCTPADVAQLREVASIQMDALVYTPQIRRITAGMSVDEILKNIDNNEKDKRKVYLYGAHDTLIGPLARAHNFTGIPIFPEFGSGVIFENLKSGDGQRYIRMFYWTGITGQLIPVKLNNCDHICPLPEYRSAVADLLPNEQEKTCFSPAALCKKTEIPV